MNAIQKAIKNVKQVDLNLSYYIHLATKADTKSNKWIMSEINRLTESLELLEQARTALREYRDENARLRATISKVEHLLAKGLYEISAAYSPDDMRIAGRAEMQLALNVISGETKL